MVKVIYGGNSKEMDIEKYWEATLQQNPEILKSFFHKDACINWHNTNERFTVDEFIRANCEYPGEWDGEIEKIIEKEELLISVVHVFSKDRKVSAHVTSFMKLLDDKIILMDEYWGDDGSPPRWRKEMNIGKAIKNKAEL